MGWGAKIKTSSHLDVRWCQNGEEGGKIFLGKERLGMLRPDGVTGYLVERGYGVLQRRFAGLRLEGPPPSSGSP